jgi:transketolase
LSPNLLQSTKQLQNRFINCEHEDQNMVGSAMGMSCRERTIPFCLNTSTQFTRTFDLLRLGAISNANIKLIGTHCGLSPAEDGPTQMGLEDLSLFCTLPEAVVFCPSDAVSTEYTIDLAATKKGLCYIRTTKTELPVIYKNEEHFEIGKCKVVFEGRQDKLVIVAGGVALREAIKAAEQLKKQSIEVCVIDPFTIKPLDTNTILERAKKCGGKILVVEDHYPEGGLCTMIARELKRFPEITIRQLAVKTIPVSGKPEELLEKEEISYTKIVHTCTEMIRSS